MFNRRDPKDRTRSGIQEEIHNIEALLKEAGTLQDKAQKRKHTQRITKLITKASTNLLTRFWDDPSTCVDTTEHNTLWASLENAKIDNTSLFVQCLELDQDRDTEGINTGDEAVDNNASDLSNNVEYTTAVEVLQITQQKVQDEPRHQHFSQGKLSAPGTMDAASYSPRSALELPEPPGCHFHHPSHHQLQNLTCPALKPTISPAPGPP